MMCGAELSKLPDGVQRVAAFLQESGHHRMPSMLQDAARTAQQAADALGVELGQIAKSIIFKRKSDNATVLVITSGDKRVDEAKVQALVCDGSTKLGRADADFVKLKTGFAIGGVAPVAHLTEPVTLLDKELFRFETVWAAAGHPNAVFEVTPHALKLLSQAPVVDVTE
jgi:prolyl-tRNA editing enzyme YbaK/EbsC (Cys-tRNA(Pro) deacylase)